MLNKMLKKERVSSMISCSLLTFVYFSQN